MTNIQFYFEKLYDSMEFEKFKKENPDAILVGGFFVIDKIEKNPDNKQHFDYFIPSIKKMFSFEIEKGVQLVPIENFGEKIPEAIKDNYDFDFDEVEELIVKEMEVQKIDKKLQKILLSLQHLENKDYLIGTVFISGMGMIKVQIELEEMKIIEFEKKSFFDLLKKV